MTRVPHASSSPPGRAIPGQQDGAGEPTAVPRVLLASSSPRRTELLARAGLDHLVVDPGEDVVPPAALAPEAAVQVVARAKAEAVVAGAPVGSFVIGADTMVIGPQGPLGKPHTAERALAMLAALRGRRHTVLTGVSVLTAGGGELAAVSRSEVTMGPFSDPEPVTYVAGGEPLDKAGAYAIQGRGAAFVEMVEGRVDTVVGLDVAMTFDLLRRAGYPEPLEAPADVPIGMGLARGAPAAAGLPRRSR